MQNLIIFCTKHIGFNFLTFKKFFVYKYVIQNLQKQQNFNEILNFRICTAPCIFYKTKTAV